MSLVKCPECNKEISSEAESCPSCGHPLRTRDKSVPPVVAAHREDQSDIPKWVIPVVLVVAAIALFGLVYAVQNSNEPEEREVTVAAAEDDGVVEPSDRRVIVPSTGDSSVPDRSTVEIPVPENNQTISPDTKSEVDGSLKDMGSVEINARVADPKGTISPVEDEKFYLLDKDLEEILDDSGLKPIAGQNLVNSFGLSVLYPDRFNRFNEKALNAINEHIKYDTLSDASGTARIKSVRPGEYILFGIHKVGKGFAIWSSPVSIRTGQNNLNIQPQRSIEIGLRGE